MAVILCLDKKQTALENWHLQLSSAKGKLKACISRTLALFPGSEKVRQGKYEQPASALTHD